MTDDDLPPPQSRPEEDSAGWQIGDLFGQSMWIVLFLAIVGGIFYLVLHATH